MMDFHVIIVGGGPAGSSCAWRLAQNGIECLILDRQHFPRNKLCAGWLTPQVFRDLKISIDDYPHGLTEFDKLHIHLPNREIKLKTRQYAIRRCEFDHWLSKRSGVDIHDHYVRNIIRNGNSYIIDDLYRCNYLVGAGGTHCPVYSTFFSQICSRAKKRLVVTLEEEFPCKYTDRNCHLWFFQNGLPGYAWYVPKSGGYVNVGIGGYLNKLKDRNENIVRHWKLFIDALNRKSIITKHQFNPGAALYYVRDNVEHVQRDNAYIIGDAAGLATRDMGEGIGPAVQSGMLAAESIIGGNSLSLHTVKKYSFSRFRTALALLTSYRPHRK